MFRHKIRKTYDEFILAGLSLILGISRSEIDQQQVRSAQRNFRKYTKTGLPRPTSLNMVLSNFNGRNDYSATYFEIVQEAKAFERIRRGRISSYVSTFVYVIGISGIVAALVYFVSSTFIK